MSDVAWANEGLNAVASAVGNEEVCPDSFDGESVANQWERPTMQLRGSTSGGNHPVRRANFFDNLQAQRDALRGSVPFSTVRVSRNRPTSGGELA